jgi:hypothetical protein
MACHVVCSRHVLRPVLPTYQHLTSDPCQPVCPTQQASPTTQGLHTHAMSHNRNRETPIGPHIRGREYGDWPSAPRVACPVLLVREFYVDDPSLCCVQHILYLLCHAQATFLRQEANWRDVVRRLRCIGRTSCRFTLLRYNLETMRDTYASEGDLHHPLLHHMLDYLEDERTFAVSQSLQTATLSPDWALAPRLPARMIRDDQPPSNRALTNQDRLMVRTAGVVHPATASVMSAPLTCPPRGSPRPALLKWLPSPSCKRYWDPARQCHQTCTTF